MKQTIRIFFFCCLISFIIIVLGGCNIYGTHSPQDFSLNNYFYYLENFRLGADFKDIEICGKIESANDAVEKAKFVMEEVYGKSAYCTRGPYSVFYDKTSDTWLVKGSYLFFKAMGAHVIFSGADGRVLAVWAEKH